MRYPYPAWGRWISPVPHVPRYEPAEPLCWARTMVHRPPEPKELERYKHSWEALPEMSGWYKFWHGIR